MGASLEAVVALLVKKLNTVDGPKIFIALFATVTILSQ